ncbi:MAG: flagellar hook assembly protein FlgD [Beijerinckiaceae bacterium]
MGTGISNLANVSTRSQVANLANAAAQTQGDKDRKTIAQNFDAFLSLLTTQLKNQSPLDPLDANQFTQQLVQFSSVEQQLKTNDYLAAMAKSFGSGSGGGGAGGKLNAASAASLIGVQVSADASTQRLSKVPGSATEVYATFPVRTQANYSNYQVTIADEQNNVVWSGPWTPTGAGEQAFVWDGRRTGGGVVDTTKKYNIQVTGELQGSNGQRSVMSTERTGVVTSVDLSGVEETVTFGSFSVPISQIKKVARAGV